MKFDWQEYLQKLFTNNPGLNPHQLWDIVNEQLTDDQAAQAFFTSAGKADLSTRRILWQDSLPKPKPIPTVGSTVIDTKITGTVKASPIIYDEYAELKSPRQTHNPSRNDPWVVWGDWTQQDFKCYEAHVSGMSSTYQKLANWAHSVQTIFMDNPEAEMLKDIYPTVVASIGGIP